MTPLFLGYDYLHLEQESSAMLKAFEAADKAQTANEQNVTRLFENNLETETNDQYQRLTNKFTECKQSISDLYSLKRYKRSWKLVLENCPESVIYALFGNLQARGFLVSYECIDLYENRERNYIQILKFKLTVAQLKSPSAKSCEHYLNYMIEEAKTIAEKMAK